MKIKSTIGYSTVKIEVKDEEIETWKEYFDWVLWPAMRAHYSYLSIQRLHDRIKKEYGYLLEETRNESPKN